MDPHWPSQGGRGGFGRLKGLKGGDPRPSTSASTRRSCLATRGRHEAVRAYFPLDHVVATTLESTRSCSGSVHRDEKFDAASRASSDRRVDGVEDHAVTPSQVRHVAPRGAVPRHRRRDERSRASSTSTPIPRREVWACRHLSSTEKMGRPGAGGLYVMHDQLLGRRQARAPSNCGRSSTSSTYYGLRSAGDGADTRRPATSSGAVADARELVLDGKPLKRLSGTTTGATLQRDGRWENACR